jgi:predicted NUDIX family NTP pyrophosphohydrolase
MPTKASAGVLMYRRRASGLEVFLVHPGGPFWARKDAGAWSIPKGEIEPGESPIEAARREFAEETGSIAAGVFAPLGWVRMRSGKVVHAWAVEGEIDADAIRSNVFTLEWPPRSGRQRQYPEADRAAWFPLAEARRRILAAQSPLIDSLEALVSPSQRSPA